MDLGTMYAYGLVYDRDTTAGLEWLIKASKQPSSKVEASSRIQKICTFEKNVLCAGYGNLPELQIQK